MYKYMEYKINRRTGNNKKEKKNCNVNLQLKVWQTDRDTLQCQFTSKSMANKHRYFICLVLFVLLCFFRT